MDRRKRTSAGRGGGVSARSLGWKVGIAEQARRNDKDDWRESKGGWCCGRRDWFQVVTVDLVVVR